jgi:predicted nucleotidyltransferase
MPATITQTKTTDIPQWAKLLPEVTDETLASLTQRIVDAVYPYRVILFGSRAWGTARPDSDIDVLVIVDECEDPRERRYSVYDAAKIPWIPMDILVRTPADIETRLAMGDFFIKDIIENGRVLYKIDRDWGKLEVHPTTSLFEE